MKINPTDPEENWKEKKLFMIMSIATLGNFKRRHHKWFDKYEPDTQSYVDENASFIYFS